MRASGDSILISLARLGPGFWRLKIRPSSVRAAPESSRRRAAGQYAHARGGLSTPLLLMALVNDGASWGPFAAMERPARGRHHAFSGEPPRGSSVNSLVPGPIRRDGVELHVPRRGQEVVFIHDERGEAALPQVPSPALRKLIHRVYRRCASPMARLRLSADCRTTIR